MSEELISSYIDKDGIQRDTDFILKRLNEVYGAFTKLSDVKVGLNGISGMGSMIPTIKIAQEETKKMTEASEKLVTTQKEQSSVQKQIDKAIAEGKVSKQQYNAELKREIELQNAANGSIEQARALIKNLTAERNKLNLTTEQGRKRQAELNQEIDRANEFIKANSDALAKQKINVGNYEGSAKIIVDALERSRLKLEQVEKQFGSVSPEAKAARGEFEALERITGQPQFLNISAKVGDATAELKGMTKVLIQLETAGQQNSDTYRNVQSRLAQLTDQIADTKQEIKALSSDTRGFDLFAGSVSFIADSFQAAAGAAVLFGASEEDAAKATKNLIAIQSVANGVKGIANELTTKGTAANKAYALVQGLVSTAMDKSAASAKRLNASLGLLGIAITVIGALVIAFDLFKRKLSETEKAQERLNKVNDKAIDGYIEQKTEIENLIVKIKSENTTNEEKVQILKTVNEKYSETTGKLRSINELETKFVSAAPGIIKSLELRAKAQAAYALAVEAAKDELKYQLQLEQETGNSSIEKMVRKGLGRAASEAGKAKDGYLKIFNQLNEEISKTVNNGFGRLLGAGADKKDIVKKVKEDAKKVLEVEKNLLQELLKTQKSAAEILNDQLEAKLLIGERLFERQKSQAEIYRNEQLSDNEKAKSAGLITEKEYNKKKEIIQADYQKSALIYEIEFYEAQLKILKAFGADTLAAELALSEARLKLREVANRSTTGKPDDTEENKYKDLLDLLERVKQKYEEVASVISGVLDAQITKEKNLIQEQIDLLDEKKLKDIEVANQTIANAEERAAAIQVIEARAAARREKLEREQREADRKKAIFEKANAIALITLNTAIAVTKFLSQGNVPEAILAGIIGAAKLAVAIATPIPKYKHGKNKHDLYEGPAIVGDGGKPELIVREDGSMEVTPDRPTITYVKSRDIVLPDARSVLAAAAMSETNKTLSGSLQKTGSQKSDSVEKAIAKMGKEMVSAINNQPRLNIESSEAGIEAILKNGANRIKYVQDQINW